MRINTGSKVEVWCEDAAPPMGAWRAGEVVWGNGHSYCIRWDGSGDVSGRIRRKSVRPLPPNLPAPRDLATGDLVEVLDQGLWKCGEVVRADAAGGEYTVKIVGTSVVVTVPLHMFRVRQVLKDDDFWVALYKGKEIPGSREPPSRSTAAKQRAGQFAQPVASHQWAKIKRSRNAVDDHDIARDVERIEANSKRIRAMEEDEEDQGVELARYVDVEVIDVNPAAFLNKPQEMKGSEERDVVGRGSNSDSGNESSSSSPSSSSSSSSAAASSESRSRSRDSSSSSSTNSENSRSTESGGRGDRAAAPKGQGPPRGLHAEGAKQPPPRCIKEEHPDDDRTESCASARKRPSAESVGRGDRAAAPKGPPRGVHTEGAKQPPARCIKEEHPDDDRAESCTSARKRPSAESGGRGDRAAAPKGPPGGVHAKGANQPPPQCIKEEHPDDDRKESWAKSRKRPSAVERPAAAAKAAKQEVVANQVHRLELHAYAALLKVFHATGGLTWKKAELLSNLRHQLHISDDEHLKQIRELQRQ